jgi:hypothetical protein
MSKLSFFVTISISWAFVLLGVWMAGNVAMLLGVIVLAIALGSFLIACLSRGRATAQPRTAKFAGTLYLIAPAFVSSGLLWKHLAFQPPILAILLVGAGVWCVGIAWTCTAALWNGSWYVTSRKPSE